MLTALEKHCDMGGRVFGQVESSRSQRAPRLAAPPRAESTNVRFGAFPLLAVARHASTGAKATAFKALGVYRTPGVDSSREALRHGWPSFRSGREQPLAARSAVGSAAPCRVDKRTLWGFSSSSSSRSCGGAADQQRGCYPNISEHIQRYLRLSRAWASSQRTVVARAADCRAFNLATRGINRIRCFFVYHLIRHIQISIVRSPANHYDIVCSWNNLVVIQYEVKHD